MRQAWVIALSTTAVMALAGCGSMRVTDTSRSGTEQLLLTSAFDSALSGVDFQPLRGVPVYLDTTNLEAIDSGWIKFRLRQEMIRQGVRLVDDPEEARAVVEAAAAAYGTDKFDWMFGIPQTNLPIGAFGFPTTSLPEMSLAKKTRQSGIAKIALFAYDRPTGDYVWESGPLIADSNLKTTYFGGGLGPIESGTIAEQLGPRGIRSTLPKLPLNDGLINPNAPNRHRPRRLGHP